MIHQMETNCEFVSLEEGYYEWGVNPYTGQIYERWAPTDLDDEEKAYLEYEAKRGRIGGYPDEDYSMLADPNSRYNLKNHYDYWCNYHG